MTEISDEAKAAVHAIGKYGEWADDRPFSIPLYPAYAEGLASRAWMPGWRYNLTRSGLAALTQEGDG